MKFVQPIRDVHKLEQIKAILKARSERDYMLFYLGINTGLRVSDLLPLTKKDVAGSHIEIKEKKTDKSKRFSISPTTKKELEPYIANFKNSDLLFSGRDNKNKPISREYAYKVIRDACNLAGVTNCGTHTMRKTFGYFFYKQFKDIAMLQKLFNHSAPSITLEYIGIVQDEIDDAYNNFSL